jgi:hypothetical protein
MRNWLFSNGRVDNTKATTIQRYHEVFSSFLNEFQNFEVLAFFVNSALKIEKVHASLPKEPELTAAFAEEILNHLEVAQP